MGKNTMKAGLAVETMSAPNPFCPNTKGVCCLMVLTNLSLILICIGFIIVLQLTDPPVVWNIGIVILVFGFVTLFITLIYCMCICQETEKILPSDTEWYTFCNTADWCCEGLARKVDHHVGGSVS